MAPRRRLAPLLAVLAVGLLFGQFTGLSAIGTNKDELRFAEKVNLALRRTAHQLLIQAGDSTSRILPVQQMDATTFLIRLERPFEYGKLPALLQQSLDRHVITQNYDVSVFNCQTGTLQLGYSLLDFQTDKTVPCSDRRQEPGCAVVRVSFANPIQPTGLAAGWASSLLGVLLLGSASFVWFNGARQPQPAPVAPTDRVELGHTAFSLANQSVIVSGITHTLTYREAKLLNLFVCHPNQLLERNFILKSVWEDEGITVGRSVDVFVSRLRKLLQSDPSLRIVAIHGVGYRLDVIGNPTGTTA